MGFFSDDGEHAQQAQYAYNEEPREEHKSKWTHELVGGAAAFEAMKLYEDRERKEGKQVNHGFAKELIAGIAGAEVDKLFETKGLDFVDREKAKHHARREAEQAYDQQYQGGGGGYGGDQGGYGGQQGGYGGQQGGYGGNY